MVMEFGEKIEGVVEKTVERTVIEGGAIAAGLMAASFLGRSIEHYVKPNVTAASPMLDKLVAWGANVAPKMGLWYYMRGESHDPGDETKNLVMNDASKAVLGSMFIDGAIRLSNGLVNNASAKVLGIDILGRADNRMNIASNANVQRVIQENSVLRGHLNQALGKLANANNRPTPVTLPPQNTYARPYTQPTPVVVYAQPAPIVQAPAPIVQVTPIVQTATPPPDHDRRFGMMQTTPEAEERRRRYGAMTPEERRKYGAMESVPPAIAERNRKYNFMGDKTDDIANMFGML